MSACRVTRRWCFAFLALLVLAPAAVGQEQAIDMERARQLRQRMLRGETLTPQERQYVERARAQLRQTRAQRTAHASLPLTPLTDMTQQQRYKGQDGGLYGGGNNVPPPQHRRAALRQAARIEPLADSGAASPDGKIGVVSIGMSNTTQEFSAFIEAAAHDPQVAPAVVLVDGAQGGMEALAWGDPSSVRPASRNPWDALQKRLQRAGLSPQQVQVVWMKQARRMPAAQGEFPAHAEEMKAHMEAILDRLEQEFPNLRIVYLSSRIYGGYAQTDLNPEPYAYETAFVVRDLILDQIAASTKSTDDGAADGASADGPSADDGQPVRLWGPYLWANGVQGRQIDDLVWQAEDFAADGTHPSERGRAKVARMLLDFFTHDPTAKPWFVR